jgi:hypothetical protein
LTHIIPLRDSAGTVYGWIGTHIDISERKRSEQELRSARDAAESALRNLKETQNFPDRGGKTRGTWATGGRCRA